MSPKIKKILKPGYICFLFLCRMNWYKTFIMNFSLLPFRQAIKFPVLVRGKLKIDSLKGKLLFNCPVSAGLILIGKDMDNMPVATNTTRIYIEGTLIINGKLFLNHSANLVVWPNATMELGTMVRIASGCIVKATEHVKINDYTSFTSGCFLMDSNVHCIKDTLTGKIKKVSSPIVIGKSCWIGMNSSIMAGTVLPDYCITGRYTFLNKDCTHCGAGTMFAGIPAKPVRNNVQRIFNLDREQHLKKYFRDNLNAEYFQAEPGVEPTEEEKINDWFKMNYFLLR
jgi:acetyltransferase-like isoleucine patch superfamily enzyme